MCVVALSLTVGTPGVSAARGDGVSAYRLADHQISVRYGAPRVYVGQASLANFEVGVSAGVWGWPEDWPEPRNLHPPSPTALATVNETPGSASDAI